MPAKLTLFPARAASRHFLIAEGRNHFVGRDPASDLFLEDPRVSGRHALFQWSGGSWVLVDLRSKNGTYVNGARVTEVPLQNGDWISFGGLLSRHERVAEADAQALETERPLRLQAFLEVRRTLDACPNIDALWRALLPAALDLAGAERGFLILFGSGGAPAACVAGGYAAFDPVDERFEDIFASLRKMLDTARPVAHCRKDGGSSPRSRATMDEIGASAGAAAPVTRSLRVVGFLAVQGRSRGGAFTELDVELLAAAADVASAALDRYGARPEVRDLAGAGEAAPGGGFLEQLEARIADLVRASRETSTSA